VRQACEYLRSIVVEDSKKLFRFQPSIKPELTDGREDCNRRHDGGYRTNR